MIRLSVPEIDINEFVEIEAVLKSGYLVQGERIQKFENELCEYLKINHAIAVSNGTAALHLSLIALGIKAGDEVIVPDFTFPATSNVVELIGAIPVFIDIDPETFNIDVEKIESKITEKTRAIIPVHEFGLSAEMDKIIYLKNKYNLKIIEDAACALGTKYNNKYVGTIGDIGCFSLHPRKAITTGEGGVIVTESAEVAKMLRILRNHGIDNSNGYIDFILPGFNYRLTDIQGAMGSVQLRKLDKIIDTRIELAKVYYEGLKNLPNIKIPALHINKVHIYQTFYIIVDEKLNRNEIMESLRKKGIECNYGAYSLHQLSYYNKKYGEDGRYYQESLKAFNQGIALPLHCKLCEKDISYIIEQIKNLTGN